MTKDRAWQSKYRKALSVKSLRSFPLFASRFTTFALCLLPILFILLLTSPLLALRIVSLTPSHTELLYELGVGDKIVGVTNFCNYPPDVNNKEKVGDLLHLNIERIFLLKPDVVFCLTENQYTDKLKKMGIKVICENPQNIDELKKTIKRIAKTVGSEKKSRQLIQEIDTIVKNVVGKNTKNKNNTVYIEIMFPPAWSCSKGSFIDEVVTLAGLKNIFSDVNKDYFQVSDEQILARNPDMILVLSGKNIKQRRGFSKISAVKNNKIVIWQDRDILIRPTMRMIRAIPVLQQRFLELQK